MIGEIMKMVEEYRVETEEQAKALIEQVKAQEADGGYELTSYTSTLKEKKSKGETIDSFYLVKLTKKWS